MSEEDKFRVVVTAIPIRPDGKMLIIRRHKDKKRWPGKWTVPGGNVSTADFLGTPTEINNQWYYVLENAVKREVKEETNLDIGNVEFVCSIGVNDSIIVSFTAEVSGDQPVKLQESETDDYAWVTYEEAKKYDLIEGLLGELFIASLHLI